MTVHLSRPLPGHPITGGYGWRTIEGGQNFHTGTDIGAPSGTPIGAAADGRVALVGWDPSGYGHYVDIDHGGGISTRYAHMRDRSHLAVGDTVQGSQPVGPVGSTGWSTGPHLHFEIRIRGAHLDPIAHISAQPPLVTPPVGQEEDEDMATRPIGQYVGGTAATPAKERKWVIYYPDSGLYMFLGGVDQAYINTQAQAHGTKPFTQITEAHWADQLRPHLDKLLAG